MMYSFSHFSGGSGCSKSCNEDVRVSVLHPVVAVGVFINQCGINTGLIDVDQEIYSLMDIL